MSNLKADDVFGDTPGKFSRGWGGGGRSGSCFDVLPIFQIIFSKPMFSRENEKQTNKKQNKNKSISNFLAYHTSDSKSLPKFRQEGFKNHLFAL